MSIAATSFRVYWTTFAATRAVALGTTPALHALVRQRTTNAVAAYGQLWRAHHTAATAQAAQLMCADEDERNTMRGNIDSTPAQQLKDKAADANADVVLLRAEVTPAPADNTAIVHDAQDEDVAEASLVNSDAMVRRECKSF